MDWYRTTVDLLDAVAWPVAVGVLATVILLLFRKDLSELLQRVRRLSTPLGSAALDRPQTPTEPEPSAAVDEFLVSVIEQQRNELAVRTQDALAWQELAARNAVFYHFEVTYRRIYGTQLQLLRHMDTHPGGADEVTVNVCLLQHHLWMRSLNPAYNYPLAAYVGFLTDSDMAMWSDHQFPLLITARGRGLLLYMGWQGLSDARAF